VRLILITPRKPKEEIYMTGGILIYRGTSLRYAMVPLGF
jgi:hypothetical protein